ncbi:MAG TPA: hypothetical protein PKK12_15305 [Candidatus Aminicenantes bacterium]|nr:hypothetical protein [Candidatus Aminicenantes bacterium]
MVIGAGILLLASLLLVIFLTSRISLPILGLITAAWFVWWRQRPHRRWRGPRSWFYCQDCQRTFPGPGRPRIGAF